MRCTRNAPDSSSSDPLNAIDDNPPSLKPIATCGCASPSREATSSRFNTHARRNQIEVMLLLSYRVAGPSSIRLVHHEERPTLPAHLEKQRLRPRIQAIGNDVRDS